MTQDQKGNRRLSAASATCVAFLMQTCALFAAEPVFDGSKARVNLSNKLEMLTQTIGSASCRINAGIGVDHAKAELQTARRDFNTIVDGLQQGSTALGIPSKEQHGVVLNSLNEVRKVWQPINEAAVELLVDSGSTAEAASLIADANLNLLYAAEILASDISGIYSNPNELTQADARALSIAGRQRMLGHRIAKELCGIAIGAETVGTTEDLSATVDMYDISLKALRHGMVEAGVNPPPSDTISAELDAVNADWQQSFATLNIIRSGETPSADNVDAFARISEQMTTDMSNVVTLYMLSTPGQEDVYRVPLRAFAEQELTKWLDNPELIAAIMQQNQQHASLSQDQIDQLDKDWRAQRKADAKPLIDGLLSRPASGWLRENQSKTANFVTEVFAMDNRGLNVAQSVETSDFWQGDEAKWQQTYGNGSGEIHISEVEFDESTGSYQSQVSMPIYDPASGTMIGAITFGVNVQSLL